jgi:RNA polymerase sigma-70 factor (ECF subfamily)
MDDSTAIQKCKAGETEAFGHLVRRYQSEAIGHAVAILGSLDDALDAVQDAFLDAYQAMKRFDVSRRFYPWLYTILRNRCFEMLASRRKQAAASEDAVELLAQTEKNSCGVAASIVDRALRELAAEDRELLTLKHLDGLSYKEIAEILGIPVGTVMSRLYYARRRFREKVLTLEETLDCRENNDD